MHAGDQGLGGGHGAVGQEHVFELVAAGRQDRSPFVDLARIQQVEHGEMLDGEHFVHAFQAEPAFAVEEVGDVRLLEPGLLRQSKSRQVALFDPFPQRFAEIILQHTEFHGREYSTGSIA